MALTFNPITKIIEVEAPATEIVLQDLINEIRDWEDEQTSISYPQVAEGSGKEDLGGGTRVGITIKLINGWRIKFEDRTGPDWTICNVRGGNLVAVDENGDAIFPIAPSAYVTATLTASSSATLQEELDIQHSSFGGCVTIDVINGVSGTTFPTGTSRQPVNNLANAKTIANTNGFTCLNIIGNITFTSGQNIDGFEIEGENTMFTTIIINSGCSTDNTEFNRATLQGTLDGYVQIHNCSILTLNGLKGEIHDSAILGDISLSGTDSEVVNFFRCISAMSGVGLVNIDMNGDGPAINLKGHIGSIKIKNKSGASKICAEFISGRISFDSTVTAGDVLLRGVGFIYENLATGITLNTDGLVVGKSIEFTKKIQEGRWKILNNQLIIYDNDGTTPLRVFNLKSETGQPTERNVYERVPE